MKDKKTQCLSGLLCICFCFSFFFCFSAVSDAAETIASGDCGDSASWCLDDAGNLTVSGTGAMQDFKHRYDRYRWDSMTGTGGYADSSLVFFDPLSNGKKTDRAIYYTEDEYSGKSFCFSAEDVDIYEELRCFCDVPWYALRDRIRSVRIAEGITHIGDFAFFHTGLRTVSIPDSVTSIGRFAFSGCEALESIVLPEALSYLGDFIFDGCKRLANAELPQSIVSIGTACFRDCFFLGELEIPAGVRAIYSSAFENCVALTELPLPGGLHTLGKNVFSGCKSLLRAAIPSGLTQLPEAAFQNCTSLMAVSIPESVTVIGENAFLNCSALQELPLPSGLKAIPKGAFRNCVALNTVVVPTGITTIGAEAFSGCTSIRILFLPLSLNEIQTAAFDNCTHQKVVYYEGSLNDWLSLTIERKNDALSSAFSFQFNASAEHEHTLIAVPARAASCELPGFLPCYRCTLCGRYYTDEAAQAPARITDVTTAPLPHALVLDPAVPVTCKQNGKTEGIRCSVCGRQLVQQDIIRARGYHNWDKKVTKEPTCTQKGEETFICKTCGDRSVKEIPALGHNFQEWETVKKATVTEEGLKARWCIVCGAKETCPIEKLKLTYSSGDVDGNGKVESADARLALRASVKLENYAAGSAQFLAADVNSDGKIGSDDARKILRVSVKLEAFV